MSVDFYQTTWHYISGDSTLHSHCCGNLKLQELIYKEIINAEFTAVAQKLDLLLSQD
jgi:hypothetical protein